MDRVQKLAVYRKKENSLVGFLYMFYINSVTVIRRESVREMEDTE